MSAGAPACTRGSAGASTAAHSHAAAGFNHLFRLLVVPPPPTEYDDLYLLPSAVTPDYELVRFPDGTVWTQQEALDRARKFASDHSLQPGEAVVLDAKASSKAAVVARMLPLVAGTRVRRAAPRPTARARSLTRTPRCCASCARTPARAPPTPRCCGWWTRRRAWRCWTTASRWRGWRR